MVCVIAGADLYIITAWNAHTEHYVRADNAVAALRAAQDLVQRGMRISIVRTLDGEAVAVSELEESVKPKS